MKLQSLCAFAATLTVGAALAGSAFASADLSINAATYVYKSYDTTGALVANNLSNASADGIQNNDIEFWTATTTFNLSSPSAALHISDLSADDDVVVLLNGVAVTGAAAGIFGPGNGYFYFTPNGSSVAQAFLGNGLQSIDVTSGFTLGANSLELIVNNNYAGINTNNGGLTGGPSSLNFSATLTGGVPEPAAWGLMMVGLGAIGGSLRMNRKRLAAPSVA
jgi:hypothetical protein